MLKAITWLLTISSALGADLPVWKAKEKIYERVQNGEIFVSVREAERNRKTGEKKLELTGGGLVAAPRVTVYEVAQRYEDLPKYSDFIKSAKYDPVTRLVTLELSAFNYKSTMQVEVKPSQNDQAAQMEYTVRTGPLSGLTGRVIMTGLPRGKTEVGLEGEFKYTEFPLPQIFLEFGIELAFRRLAFKLRTQAEQEARPK